VNRSKGSRAAGSSFENEQVERSPVGGGVAMMVLAKNLEAVTSCTKNFGSCHKLR
jgi:hypothetical protein